MAHRKSLAALDKTLQDLQKNISLMGGIVFLLLRDCRQKLPVISKSTRANEIKAYLKQFVF